MKTIQQYTRKIVKVINPNNTVTRQCNYADNYYGDQVCR